MSQTEVHIGKLKKLEGVIATEEWFKSKCVEQGRTELPIYQSWKGKFLGINQYKYFVVGDEVWEAVEHKKLDPDDDINYFVENTDGTITFITQFYNGGTYLEEVLEDELSKLKSNR